MYDVTAIRSDFPILSRQVNGKPLVYLDNGASAQKPQAVIDAISHCVHLGHHRRDQSGRVWVGYAQPSGRR